MQKKSQPQSGNTTVNFSELTIPFSEDNHSSVFFAHLQNVFREFREAHPQIAEDLKIGKIDRILFDIYGEHQKVEADLKTVSKGVKDMMKQFSTMLEECKSDKEELMKATEDKQKLMAKLKESHLFSQQLFEETQILKTTNAKLSELNSLLVEKQEVLEEQLQNTKLNKVSFDDFSRITKQYDRLLSSNTEMRKDLIQIAEQTQILNEISLPLQVICNAFQENPELRDELWRHGGQGKENKIFAENQQSIKKKYYEFDFSKILQRK